MGEISFAKNVLEQKKIKELVVEDKQYLTEGLTMLFTRIPNLMGVKEAIPQINKDEIKELLLTVYKGISLEQIDYAFKLERFGVYEEKTQHFQMFDASYVSDVLKKFKNWLANTRRANNLEIFKPEKKKELTKLEKEKIVEESLNNAITEFILTGKIETGNSYLYDYLFEKKKLPLHTAKFKRVIKQKAIRNLHKKKGSDSVVNKELKKIQNGHQDPVNVECKYIILRTYFCKIQQNEK